MSINNVYIKQIHRDDHRISELDYQLHSELGFNYDDYENFVTLYEGAGIVDNAMLKIEDLEKIVASFKEKGATHISIEHHMDHIGYDFSAYDLRCATHEEIYDYLNAQKKDKDLRKQIEIDTLKKRIERLEKE